MELHISAVLRICFLFLLLALALLSAGRVFAVEPEIKIEGGTKSLRENILQQMRGLSVVQVKIYDLAGKTSSRRARDRGQTEAPTRVFSKQRHHARHRRARYAQPLHGS